MPLTLAGLTLAAMGLCQVGCAQTEAPVVNAGAAGNPYGQWSRGPLGDPGSFPIAAWLQSPHNAQRFKDAGMNLFIGLWEGPTDEQLAALTEAGMPVICDQNEVALQHLEDPIIVAWMHGDEPDNAQADGWGGWGPPIHPTKIVADYERIRKADPSRPVLLNLGQGVAWDGWYGRGVRTRHPEDYAEYIKGGDIISYDIYPVVHDSPEVKGKLELVPFGVDRLREWTGDKKVVWNCIECTRISNLEVKPTPAQVRSEVWMALIHGSMGLVYFAHQFEPNFIEAGLLADDEMTAGVTALNQQIQSLAPVLNSPSLPEAASVASSVADVPIDVMVKRHEGATYVFAAAMRDGATTGGFEVKGMTGAAQVEVLGEGRTLEAQDGRFEDEFEGYGVHLYKVQ